MGRKIKNIMGSEQGATSVLVVFMMIVLVTLGAFAITSARVNYRFSETAVEWNQMFYALDSLGEGYLRDVDEKLARAQTRAVAYFVKEEYAAESPAADIPVYIHDEIHAAWLESDDKTAALQEGAESLYKDLVFDMLWDLTGEYPGMNLQYGEQISADVEFTAMPDETELGITVSVAVQPFTNYAVMAEDGDNVVVENIITDAPRFRINEWRQWQVPPESDYTPSLFDFDFFDFPG